MFALIMNATIIPKMSSIPNTKFEHVVSNIYVYGNMWCC